MRKIGNSDKKKKQLRGYHMGNLDGEGKGQSGWSDGQGVDIIDIFKK